MRKFRSKWKTSLMIFLGTFVLLAFQNCSQVHFSPAISTDSLKLNSNGGFYGGKPTGYFYRLIPDFTCEQKVAPAATLELSNSDVTLTENKTLLCGAIKQSLNPSLIDWSLYQNEIIGYLEGIYEGKDSAPDTIPANLVEVWCKDGNSEKSIETITRYDRNKNLALSRVYYSQSGVSKQINDFAVSRVASQTTVIVKDRAGAFDLTVHRDQPSPQRPGLFKAELTLLIEGQILSRETECRLGGSVDPKVWPARQIVDFDTTNFIFSPDLGSMAWSSASISNGLRIYTAMINGNQQKPVSPPYLTEGERSVWFTPDSRSVLYTADRMTAFVRELFKVNLDGSGALQINEPLRTFNQKVGPSINISSDSSKVFYSDGSQMDKSHPGAPDEPWLRINGINGGIPLVLFPPSIVNTQAPPGNCAYKPAVASFDYSDKYDRVALLGGGDYCEDIYLVNADGRNLMKVTPPLPSSDWRFDWATGIQIPADSDYAVTNAQTFRGQFQSYAVPLNGSAPFPITGIWNSIANTLLASGNIFYVSDGKTNISLINLESRKHWNIPLLSSPFLSKDKSRMYGISSDGSAVSISTIDGHMEIICRGTDRKAIFSIDDGNNSLLVGFYDSLSLVQIDLWSPSSSSCSNITRFPVENLKNVSLIKLAPDQKRLMIRVGFPNEDMKSLYYIPLNQQSPLLVNMPISRDGKVLAAEFSQDSTSIVYRGNQLNSNEAHVFLWKVPVEP